MMSNLATEGTVIERDTEFWFEDSLKVFRVEQRLFRITIRQLVNESEYFKDLFQEATPSRDCLKGEEGASEEFPIIIQDETASAFGTLLRWIFNRPSIAWSKETALEALRISHKFRVHSLTQASMRFLSTQKDKNPTEILQLCHTYQLDLTWAADTNSCTL
ncbi:hypothetical protein DL96DRAFT_1649251, partial [Flagelloscypha sp. PMI_526]